MTDAIFASDLFAFLRQLKRHNNRDWFAKNKTGYQDVLVEPALNSINDFAPHVYELSPLLLLDARSTRGSLFRTYRDVSAALQCATYANKAIA